MFAVCAFASSAALLPDAPRTGRRAVLRGAASAAMLPSIAWAQQGVPEGMKTSESYTNLQQISPETTGTLGAGTMSSRSRPVTGIVLLEEVTESGKKKEGVTISAELVLDGGVAATATFEAAPGYDLNRGMFYDVEVRSKAQDGSFLQVAALPSGKTILDMADSFFTKKVFSTEGRFGAYGAPTDIKVLSTNKPAADAKGARLLELSFSALSPGGTEVARKALVAAYQPEGAANVVMLVGGSTTSAWKKSEPALRAMAASYRIARVRPTSILRKAKNDYRFEDQGGLNERKDDSVF